MYKSYKARSSFKDFTGERIEVRSGDIFVKHIAGKQKEKILRHMIESTKGNRLFVEIFEEIQETKDLVGILGLEYMSLEVSQRKSPTTVSITTRLEDTERLGWRAVSKRTLQ